MTAILRHEPAELPPDVPAAARQIVHRCLEKNPEERFQSARDLAFALRHLTGSSANAEPASAGAPAVRRPSLWLALAGFSIGVVAAGMPALRWADARDDGVDPVQLTRIAADRLNELAPAFSPDGGSVAYLRTGGALTDLLVQSVDALVPLVLVTSEARLSRPGWSPDGNRVCYTTQRQLMCVGAAGGTPQPLLESAFSPQFAPDGEQVFFIRVHEGLPWLFRSTIRGGEPQRLGDAPLPADVSALSPVSPDGSTIVAFGASGRWLLPLGAGARRALPVEDGAQTASIAWLPDSRHAAIVERTTNPIGSRLVIANTRGPARRLVVRSADPITAVTASPDGSRLVYSAGPVELDLVEYAMDGRFVRTVAASANLEGFPAWAPRGDRFLYRVGGPGQIDSPWIAGADGTPATPIVRWASNFGPARISPDGGRVVFADPAGIHVASTSGGRAIRLVSLEGFLPGVCWSADGDWIWYASGPVTLGRVPSHGGDPVQVQASPGRLLDCSPDGQWLVQAGPTGGLMLTATDGSRERHLTPSGDYVVSGGSPALFGEGGKVIYLLGIDRRSLTVVDVETGAPVRSVAFDLPPEDTIQDFAVDPSGMRVLLTIGGERSDLWMAEGFARPARSWRRWFRHWEPPAGAGL